MMATVTATCFSIMVNESVLNYNKFFEKTCMTPQRQGLFNENVSFIFMVNSMHFKRIQGNIL